MAWLPSTKSSLVKFRRLSWPQRRILVRALFLLPLISISLRLFGFNRTRRSITYLLPSSLPDEAPPPQDSALLGRAFVFSNVVRAAARHGLTRPACLEQSLVLWWLLRRQGFPAELRLGARKEHRELAAHAWVELHGVALEEASAPGYVAFESPSPAHPSAFGASSS